MKPVWSVPSNRGAARQILETKVSQDNAARGKDVARNPDLILERFLLCAFHLRVRGRLALRDAEVLDIS